MNRKRRIKNLDLLAKRLKKWRRVLLQQRLMLVGIAAILIVAAGIGLFTGLSGCQSQPATPPPRVAVAATVGSIKTEPMVRIRIVRDAAIVQIQSRGELQVGAPNAQTSSQLRTLGKNLRVSLEAGQYRLEPIAGQSLNWQIPTLTVKATNNQPIQINGKPFPGTIWIHRKTSSAGQVIDIVNHVPLETYLPGVLAKELYPKWHRETFRSQAIAARSYAINNLTNSRRRHYDMENTQASQAYIGITNNSTALQAVRDTRGLVLAYNNEIVTAYYSSSCGGVGQDATAIVPNEKRIPPLLGKQRGDWCKESSLYRWRVVRNRQTLSKRIALWGAAHGYSVKGIGVITQITASENNQAGRPTKFQLSDTEGKRFELRSTSLRTALNFGPKGWQKIERPHMVRSSHIAITFTGNNIVIQGAGFGHGVGMCQYGAQAMAKKGYQAQGILSFYYPQSEMRRAYK